MNDLHSWLVAELAERAEPPPPDLVGGALRRGRRLVLRRRLAATVTAVVVALSLGAVGWFVPWPTTALTGPARPGNAVAGKADAATIVVELGRRLPAGVTLVAAYRYEGDPPAAAVYLRRDGGTGLVQLTVDEYPMTDVACQSRTCNHNADGSTTVIAAGPHTAEDACLEDTVVQRFRPDGVHISLYLASCLMWDGQRYPPARAVLSVDEAVAITADPAWGVSMDARLVADGVRRHPALPSWTHR